MSTAPMCAAWHWVSEQHASHIPPRPLSHTLRAASDLAVLCALAAAGDGAAGVCAKNSATVCLQYNWSVPIAASRVTRALALVRSEHSHPALSRVAL